LAFLFGLLGVLRNLLYRTHADTIDCRTTFGTATITDVVATHKVAITLDQ
jgi:hypothetical protein